MCEAQPPSAQGSPEAEQAEAGVDAPVPKLVEEVVRQILAAVVHP